MKDTAAMTKPALYRWRAWLYLVRTSWRRQARAHLMVWIAAGLMLFLALAVALLTNMGAWDLRTWRQPRRGGLTYPEWVLYLRFAPHNVLNQRQAAEGFKPAQRPSDRWAILYQQHQMTLLLPPEHPAPPPVVLVADPVQIAVSGAVAATLENAEFRRQVGLVRFSQAVVFAVFTSFLLPLCSLSFATEALGREREQRNLLWTLTRPLPRWAIYLGKFVAMLPWCLALNVGGFAVICAAAGDPGLLAFSLYWPAVALGTLAFAALFHLMGAIFRRPAVIAILYSFFLETVMGNLPGHLKRGSISFYTRSLMYDHAGIFQLQPDRPLLYSPVSGFVAIVVLTGASVALLGVGCWVFSRTEYLDLG
jgi:ABC-2 type transport system permease protein